MKRRDFIKAGLAVAVAPKVTPVLGAGASMAGLKPITIAKTDCGFEREPMIRPFGFKGGYLTEEWIVSAYVRSASGKHGIGLGTQNCLWSDANVFASNSEAGGNSIMFSMTQHALKLIVGRTFTSPVELNDWLWPQVWEYGKKVSDNPKLRATYALNALVAVDNAVWVLFARENGFSSFDEMIPGAYRPSLAAHHAKCASIPLFSYKVPVSEIKQAVDSGYFFMKIKIGQPGTQDAVRMGYDHELGGVPSRYCKVGYRCGRPRICVGDVYMARYGRRKALERPQKLRPSFFNERRQD